MNAARGKRSGLVLGWLVLVGVPCLTVQAQSGPTPAQTAPAYTQTAPATGASGAAPAVKTVKKPRSTTGRVQTIPMEQAAPATVTPDETPAQRAADQKLLQQQQAQSAQAAQVTDQQVRTAQQRIDKVQSEQRIQDAPGPSQTGIVPAAGAPVLPAAGGSSVSGGAPIQDAPGPSLTQQPTTQTGIPDPASVQTTPPPQG